MRRDEGWRDEFGEEERDRKRSSKREKGGGTIEERENGAEFWDGFGSTLPSCRVGRDTTDPKWSNHFLTLIRCVWAKSLQTTNLMHKNNFIKQKTVKGVFGLPMNYVYN